jgi:NAD(P)-dependent dehydrogenase (short-subunit alcohol dehydrogenase family)
MGRPAVPSRSRRYGVSSVCITGVSRGLGLGFAEYYLKQGWDVYGSLRDPNNDAVKKLAKKYKEMFTVFTMDVSDYESVRRGAAQVRELTDHIDLLVNNAGINAGPNAPTIPEISHEKMHAAFSVNVMGPLYCVQAFLPLLEQSDGAKVVMISSSAGSISDTGGGRMVPYCVSKSALNMLTKLLWFRLRDVDIPIVALHPGWVRTDMGGTNGRLSVKESVEGMASVIEELRLDSALYQDYSGDALPW